MDDTPTRDSWRREGTCAACALFESDYGSPPELYGHCKMHRRTGSRSTSDYACGEFKPLPGFDDTVEYKQKKLEVSGVLPHRQAKRSPSPKRAARASSMRVVRRRQDGDGGSVERATEVLDDGLVAALTGTEGGDAMDRGTLTDILINLVQDFIAVEPCEIGQKWQGGTVTFQPADPDLKPHVIDVEGFFHKIVMVRDRLRVLEQKVNGHKVLSDADKVQLQQYISGCYGSLTTFNVLFKNKSDKFSSK